MLILNRVVSHRIELCDVRITQLYCQPICLCNVADASRHRTKWNQTFDVVVAHPACLPICLSSGHVARYVVLGNCAWLPSTSCSPQRTRTGGGRLLSVSVLICQRSRTTKSTACAVWGGIYCSCANISIIFVFVELADITRRRRVTSQSVTTSWYAVGELVCDRFSTRVELLDRTSKKKERIVLREIHLRTTGRHLSMGSHSVICHPTEVTAPPSPQPGRLVLDLSTP